MSVIAEVLYDLYVFAVKYRFGFATQIEVSASPALWTSIQPPAIMQPSQSPAQASVVAPPVSKNTGYVSASSAYVYVLPTRTFDGVVGQLVYGASFSIIGSQGKWLQIISSDLAGWLRLDETTRNKEELAPCFIDGEQYTSDHSDTEKLRMVINDEFHAAEFDLPLQDVEYVEYKLVSQNRHIAWPTERPRVAGTWQRILKGVSNIHLGISPKTDSVMEYINADNTGHVVYVEAVYPDESIFVSEIGYPDEGRYHERTLTKDEWIELRPVFIEIA